MLLFTLKVTIELARSKLRDALRVAAGDVISGREWGWG